MSIEESCKLAHVKTATTVESHLRAGNWGLAWSLRLGAQQSQSSAPNLEGS